MLISEAVVFAVTRGLISPSKSVVLLVKD